MSPATRRIPLVDVDRDGSPGTPRRDAPVPCNAVVACLSEKANTGHAGNPISTEIRVIAGGRGTSAFSVVEVLGIASRVAWDLGRRLSVASAVLYALSTRAAVRLAGSGPRCVRAVLELIGCVPPSSSSICSRFGLLGALVGSALGAVAVAIRAPAAAHRSLLVGVAPRSSDLLWVPHHVVIPGRSLRRSCSPGDSIIACVLFVEQSYQSFCYVRCWYFVGSLLCTSVCPARRYFAALYVAWSLHRICLCPAVLPVSVPRQWPL